MNVKHLQKRKARRWMLLLLMLPLMAARAYAYDFSAVCSTGQTLYYNITDAVNHTVELTCPNHVEVDEEGYFISLYPWQNFQMPTGSITLPETVENNGVVYTVTSVGDFAFFYCEGLTGSLRIPNSVTAIGNYAFEYCSGFNSLTIGSSVTTIGDYAFHGCTGFRRTLSIPGTVTTIGNYAFYECSGFSGSLTIPNSVTSIGVYAFAYCTGFTGSLTIGNSVTTIGTDAFFRCTGFTGTLTIGSSVTTIGFAAFGRCTGFTGTLTIPNSVTTIDDYAFEYCSGLTGSLTIPNTVTTLGEYAFIGCTGFDGSLTLSNSLTAIRDYTFSECSNLTGLLTIPESVDSIGNSAFYKCSGFTGSLTIPESVTTIGNGAFYKCSGFTGSLTIPESVTTIGYSAFYDCSGFTGSLTIPNSVTTIGSSAFAYCTGFTGSLTLPNSLTTISDDAFYSCSGFTGSLTIPESVTTIGSGAFASCRGFTGSLTIPNSVTTISDNAFYSCSGFTGSLTIGSSVTTIDYYAFAYCYYFTSIISKAATPPAAGSSCFSLSTSIPVSVPCGSTEAYRQAAQWSRFTNYSENLPFDVVVASSDEAMGSVAIIQEASCDDNQVIVQATPVLGYQFVNWTTDFYYFEGFEEGIPSDWATIDADGDGETWFASTEYEAHDILAIPSHGGSCHLMSESHCNVNGPLFPDNYLVMPRVSLPGGAVFSFWAAAQDVEFAQEHFGVAVSMGSQTNPNDFTLVGGAEWTISPGRSHSGNVRGGNRESTAWIKYTVDLSAYAGQDCYIAIRHFGCTEQQALCIDDVELISDEPMPVSDMATYSFLLTEDVMLTANFAPVEGYDIRVYANPVAGGTVTGAGIYGEMETVTVSATPNEDYRFVNWTESMIDSTSTFFESFENGLPSGWSTINADGDGHNWYHSTEAGSHNVTPGSAHSSSGFMLSESYCRANNQALNPDEYLVLPIMSIGDSCAFSFWACAYSSSWADEHFGVAISTNGNTNANDFTTINEWTLTAKSERGDNPRAQGNWYQYTVDLSAYSGQNIYVAIRHFNCSDQYILYVDDVELSSVITTTNEVLSTDPVYTFEATSNRQLVANFEYIGVVHVTPDGTGDGSSWDNALSNIQEAINLAAASNPKPRVWVKAGTYSGNSGDSDMHQITAYADATSTVGYLPMYGNYAYAYTRSQYVIPASEITSMTENFINSLTYYTTYNPSQWTSDFNVYLKEVDYTTMNDNGLIDPATATTVYTGRLSVADGQMVVTFDTPYYYRGGNLLIGMDCLSNDGNSSSCYFQAAYVTGAGGYAYDYDSPEFDYWNQVNYAPTTTFGYYNPDRLFTMAEGINVYGCFAGDEPHDYDLSLRDFVTNQTVLDGQHEHRVLYQLYDFTMQTVWDGFTIVNGYSDDEGGGAYLMANTKLQNCVFEHCQGIDGGAVYANGTEFVNCAFRKNAASDDGGALYVDGNGGQFVNCLFANNQADRGGAVYGISAYGCFAEFVNCNIVNNKSTYWGSGIYNLTPCGILHNCIVWGNESDSEAGQVFGEGSFSYCAVEGGISGENNIVLNSQNTGNGCTYPRFENPSLTAGADDETENVSWRLMENSACINHGNNEAIAGYATDLDGEDRIQLDVVDMGCYESPYEGIVIPDDGIVYVALDGNGDGTSWENALNDIQEAMGIAAASDPKSMVWVKAGTYSNDSGNRGMGQITAYADGTATVGTLPMYGLFADAYTRSQYVIPATEIAQMTGYSIYSLTYHTTSTPAQWQASFQVYLKEVNYTTMNSLIAPTTATTVYTGKLTVANGKMTIVFDTPYYYNGGNLLIGMDCLEKGNYANCKFQAAAVNGAGMYAYNYDASTFGTPHAVNYAPTTTFNFGEDLFLMVEGVNVYGGFAGNEPADYDLSLRDFEANQTVLDGQNEHSVLYQLDDFTTQTVWDGFTIANGHSDGNGAGAYLMANTKLQNCVFENCQGNDGGAVYANGAELVNCVFKKNTASNVGAVYVKNGVIVSSLFANNQADNGGGVYADGASEFINCDIVNNKAVNSGAGIYSNGGTFTNCIVWGNESDNEAGQVFGEGIFSYCAVEGRISGENNIVLNAQNIGNGCTYPRFENPSVTAGADDETENVSWRLMENSACINHGNNEAIAGYDLDIDGEDRIQLDVVDLGCYESPYEGIVIPDDGIVYVTPDGNGDGTSWENALNDIQEAMEMAAGADPKSMVWVAAGTYAGNGSIGGHLTAYANGSTTVNRLPMYALFADSYTRSQYVIPAAEIAQLTGYPIKSLTYYTTSTPAQLTSSFQVYLTEVDYSTMSSLIDPTTATTVYTGQLTVANGKMTVVFDAPYYYNGGNLLIGMDCIEKGNFANCYFQAEAVDGAGMYAFSSSSPTFSTPTVVNSIPTTTFSYGDGEDLFMMMEDVNVYGGFAGNEPADYDLSSRDFETNQTVLDGQHTRRVLRQAADFTIQTLWDGFTIANGYNVGNGGGAYLMTNSTLQNCVFENNQGSYGGAVYGGYDSRVTLVNCTFRNNTASTSGGAVFAYGGSLSGCLFTSNQAKYGGAVYANSSSVETEIENCDFRKNVASTSGGAIYTHAGRYANCLFENNRANYGGGLYVDNRYGSSEFINCDIVNNSGTYGGGIYNNSNGSTFTNCIVWGNANSQVSGNSSFSYCAVEGGISGENNICLTSQNAGNGYLSPRFENPSLTAGVDDETENVSWRLMEGSACINKGNNEAVADYEMDFAGESRIQQDVVDMGCYESPYEGTDIPEFTDGIVYVTPEGSGDGTSWSNATNDIQKALQMASLTDPRPMVWVA
ncbi:MAG: leucine-rich repeat protein, partial [bacterium]|nr:leucine-rich repeat protein [Candidatus Limimorpha equi]